MRKVQYNVVERDTRNASGKAKKDVCKILSNNNYKYLYRPSNNRYLRIIQQIIAISKLKKEEYLFVQYPANLDICYKYLKSKTCLKFVIIHDLESLRGTKNIQKEISILNEFNAVISHNAQMSHYLKLNGLTTEIFDLEIFDYLMTNPFQVISTHNKKEVTFAGNLAKSTFLQEIGRLANLKFLIYGAPITDLDKITKNENVEYAGVYTSEKLIENLHGGWGLVWDGDSIDTCNGISGEYMRYNCPHKVSMYIVAERPIIIWRQAAIANYIIENNLGIAVDTLYDIDKVIDSINEDMYQDILCAVRIEKEKLIHGYHLNTLLKQIENKYL